MPTPFEQFVNLELPKRISTEQNPLTLGEGYIPVSTGIGLGVAFVSRTEFIDGISAGKSAYEIATEYGFTGSEEEWLESLRGASAYDLAIMHGYTGTVEQWLAQQRGMSAYEIAVYRGFVGTEEEWLGSLSMGLVTAKKLLISSTGTAVLPTRPFGDILHNLAMIHLTDGSVIEVTDVTVRSEDGVWLLQIDPDDFDQLRDMAVSLTVSYMGKV